MEWVSVFPDCFFPGGKLRKLESSVGTEAVPELSFSEVWWVFCCCLWVFLRLFLGGGGAEMSFIRSDFNLQQFRGVNANFTPVYENSEDLLENFWRF